MKQVVKNVPEMGRHLIVYVKSEMCENSNVTDGTNKKFFPRSKTTRCHMVHTIQKLRHSKVDQECLTKKIMG